MQRLIVFLCGFALVQGVAFAACQRTLPGAVAINDLDTVFVVHSLSGNQVLITWINPDGPNWGLGILPQSSPRVIRASQFGDFYGTIRISSAGPFIVSSAAVVRGETVYNRIDPEPNGVCP